VLQEFSQFLHNIVTFDWLLPNCENNKKNLQLMFDMHHVLQEVTGFILMMNSASATVETCA